ncbi:MAG: MBL fold metallo-hydrolase [Rhodobacteraceae bacterium]|nr:MBL fold metallo-hydrolase [Paracoccaceae bacterium]
MANFFEIDFIAIDNAKSGDAIPIRYGIEGRTYIHVVDGGYQDTGKKVVDHIREHYGNPSFIDHVVATHPDGDHAGGLRKVLEEFDVGVLWMHRPWLYTEELIGRFSRFTNVENLRARLRDIYPNIVALEEIADEKGIEIREAFQGTVIGAFMVMAPTKIRYLELVIQSEKSPEATKEVVPQVGLGSLISSGVNRLVTLAKSVWGAEIFSTGETSSENEMSIVQLSDVSTYGTDLRY